MAWAVADIPANEVALAAADTPLLLWRNWLYYTGASGRWNTGGAGADASASGFEAKFGYDEFDHILTKPNAAGTAWHFYADLGASAPGEIDAFTLKDHNLGTISGVRLRIDIDNAADFSTLTTILDINPVPDNDRLISLVLADTGVVARRFTAVRYIRMRLTKGSNFTPQFSEIGFMRRRQLERHLLIDYDPYSLTSEISRFDPHGPITDYVFAKNRRAVDGVYATGQSQFASEFKTAHTDDGDGGTKPFYWVEYPNSAPKASPWMKMRTASLVGPGRSTTFRKFELHALEHGYNFLQPEL